MSSIPAVVRVREVDNEGRYLCTAALWDMKPCGREGDCDFSHTVPPAIRAKYDGLKEEKRLAKENAAAARRQSKRVPSPTPVSPDIEALRQEHVVVYNPEDHELGKLVAALLECVEGEELHELHKRTTLPTEPPLCPTLQHAFKLGGRKIPRQWVTVMGPRRNKKVISRMHNSAEYKAWLEGYDEWVRKVVLPKAGNGKGIYYQRPPTLRIAMPSWAATIGIHRDADYPGHHPAEINFWCPLVNVANTNTLWVESEPGKEDYRSMDLDYGQCLVFNGNLCKHFTKPNKEGRTRVSFDLRCIPAFAVDGGGGAAGSDGLPPSMIGDYGVGYMVP